MLDNVIAGVAAAGARLVFVDNLYAYAPAGGVLTSDSPEHATDPKGRLRATLGRRVLAAHRDGTIRAVIGRFSDYFGPDGDNFGLAKMALRPGMDGKTMRGLFDLDQPHAFHYLPDAARGFAAMANDAAGDGQIWVLPTHAEITQREMLERVNPLLPKRVRVGRVGPAMVWLGGLFNAMIRESRSVSVQYDRPWQVDGSAFEATFGLVELTPLDEALQSTLDWIGGAATAGEARAVVTG